MNPFRFLAAAALCAFATGSQAASEKPVNAPAKAESTTSNRVQSGLVVAGPASGGYFAPGQRSTYRILNASSQTSMGPLAVKASDGFKVESSTCSSGLAPRASCTVVVFWKGADRSQASGELVVASSSPALEVRSSLRGDSSLKQ